MKTDEARLQPGRSLTTSKAGTKGLVSLLRPGDEAVRLARPTISAPK